MVTPINSQKGYYMIQILYILLGMVILLFIMSIIIAVAPDKKKKEEEKPTSKTPIKIELQIEYEGYLYTLYNDGTWEIDITW